MPRKNPRDVYANRARRMFVNRPNGHHSDIHVSAYDDIGRLLVAGIEVLHMCDRRAALRSVRSLLPIRTDHTDLVRLLESVGAVALARDLKESEASAYPSRRRSR